ncbi:MAG: hypothetical protein D6748_01035 [Calditrichaeota bacterium]|nr:MAG: hypothetical protein D6748_01035 [Calditrichota bacterium]
MERLTQHLVWLFLLIVAQISVAHAQDFQSCGQTNCHDNLISQQVMHPALEDGCDTCHEGEGEEHPGEQGAEFEISSPVPELCYDCHDEKNTEKYVHDPVDEGDCLECHNPHGSPNKFMLEEWPPVNLCETCHDSEIWETKIQHGALKDGECNLCHNPHQSNVSKLLKKPTPELCFNCHEEQKEQNELSTVHSPFEDGCLDCHQPHGGEKKKLLVNTPPLLCFDCHDDLQSEAEEARLVHKPFQDSRACLNCHSPHASEYSSLMLKDEYNLCYTCHNDEIEGETRKIKNIKSLVIKAKSSHDPVAEDGCLTCHSPHYTNNPFLLNGAFPEGNYVEAAADSFALCFDCHDSEIIESRNGDVTGFRDGNRNLHYLHVNKKKGRTCINCHSVHGSEQAHLITTKVPFGKWTMPVKYQRTETGGSCLPGCHEEKSYNNKKPLP